MDRCSSVGRLLLMLVCKCGVCRCVHGISYREACLPVLESKSADRRYTFGISLLKRILEVGSAAGVSAVECVAVPQTSQNLSN